MTAQIHSGPGDSDCQSGRIHQAQLVGPSANNIRNQGLMQQEQNPGMSTGKSISRLTLPLQISHKPFKDIRPWIHKDDLNKRHHVHIGAHVHRNDSNIELIEDTYVHHDYQQERSLGTCVQGKQVVEAGQHGGEGWGLHLVDCGQA